METIPIGLTYERTPNGNIKNCEQWNNTLWPHVLLACTNCHRAYAGHQKRVEAEHEEDRLFKETHK